MNAGRWTLYALGFLAELLAWAGCGAVSFLIPGVNGRWEMGGFIAGVVVVAWGVFMSPRATLPLPTPVYYVVKALIYLWALVVWILLAWWVAVVFVALVAVSEPALYRRRQEEDAAKRAAA